jgi:hypothetical protein
MLHCLSERTPIRRDRRRPGHLRFDGDGTERFDVLSRYEDGFGVAEQIGPLLARGEADVLN